MTVAQRFLGWHLVPKTMLLKMTTKVAFEKGAVLARAYLPKHTKHRHLHSAKALMVEFQHVPRKSLVQTAGRLTARLRQARISHQTVFGYSKNGQATGDMIFPTGIICLLFKKDLSVAEKRSLASAQNCQIVNAYGRSPFLKVRVPNGRETTSESVAARWSRYRQVAAAAPDFHYYGQVTNTICQDPSDVLPPWIFGYQFEHAFVWRAWRMGRGKPGVDVAVIDANFLNHSALEYNFAHAYDAADYDNDPRTPLMTPDEAANYPVRYLHGTQMSGIIAGKGLNNDYETRGVAPSARIVPIRSTFSHFDPFSQTRAFLQEWVAQWIDAMIHIYYSQAKVINLSGTIGINPEVIPDSWLAWLNWLCLECNNGQGRFFSASAGNNSDLSEISFVARQPGTFAVGWASPDSLRSLGATGPGLDLSVPGGAWFAFEDNNGATFYPGSAATSGAAAVVSGTAALIYGQGNFTSREVAEILRHSTWENKSHNTFANPDGYTREFGYGFLDAFAAVKQARKAKIPAGRVIPIRFENNLTYTLIQQGGGNPWFWCLVPESDGKGPFWMHWQPEAVFGVDISAGANPPGRGLVVGDFNGDGLDEIAVQQAGSRQHCFDIVRYRAANRRWYRMGTSQDARGSALVWGSGNSQINKVLGADIDGDGKKELVARRDLSTIEAAKFAGNQWKRYGPSPAGLQLYQERVLNPPSGMTVRSVEPLAVEIGAMRRPDVRRDLVVALSQVKVEFGSRQFDFIGSPTEIRTMGFLSLHRYQSNGWQPQVLDGWGTTHIQVPFTPLFFIDDFDGDGQEEIVLFVRGEETKLVMIDLAYPFSRSKARPGFEIHEVIWPWDQIAGTPVPGHFHNANQAELACLEKQGSGTLHFLRWEPNWRLWMAAEEKRVMPVGNRALDFEAADVDNDGQTEILLRLEKPFGNTYHVYKISPGAGMDWLGTL